jgi:hypothetical protein
MDAAMILTIAIGVFAGLVLFRIRWLLLALIFALLLIIAAHVPDDNDIATPDAGSSEGVDI